MVDGRDISSAISNRLVSLTLVDARGVSSDSLQIELHDADGQLEIPPLGAKIELALGWKGSPLIDKGSYTVDELEYSGPPDKLTIYARSADLRASQANGLSAQKSRSHHNTTLGELVSLIASEHGLKASVSQGLKECVSSTWIKPARAISTCSPGLGKNMMQWSASNTARYCSSA